MSKKIFRSILLVAFTVLLASLVIATSFLYDYFNGTREELLSEELDFLSARVENEGTACLEGIDSSVFRFTLIDENGNVIYDNLADADELENHLDRKEVKEALKTGRGNSTRYSSTLTERTIYEAVLLTNGNVLRISMSQLSLGALIIGMLPGIAAILFIAIIISMFLSYKTTQKIVKPLESLDLENPLENDSYEELAPVLKKINSQRKRINMQMTALKQRTDEFEQIIDSMKEGLILLNEKRDIVSMNRAANEIFSLNESKMGCNILAADRSVEMSNAVNEAYKNGHSEFIEQKNGKEYQFDLNLIRSDSKIIGLVILGFDITERVFAERNRKEFTANVSHELKTPLQSIIGSAELLESGLVKDEEKNRFIGNIKRESIRLVELINDIIRLSELDEKPSLPEESVGLCELSEEVIESLSTLAAKNEVKLEMIGENCKIKGIRSYLYEIIYNLCDNGIRYNKKGGKVTIDVKKDSNKVVLSVSDSGIGIGLEHQHRIFERFYRVDKSHSKETGGTGLGLSIVKHAAIIHNAELNLKSEVGKGTTATVIFPI